MISHMHSARAVDAGGDERFKLSDRFAHDDADAEPQIAIPEVLQCKMCTHYSASASRFPEDIDALGEGESVESYK